MPGQNINITAYCSIRNQTVYKNGLSLFSSKEPITTADFLVAAYNHFGVDYPKFYKMDNLSKLGFMATEVLLAGRDIPGEYSPGDAGIVLSNANASLDADLDYFETVKNIPSPAKFVYTLPNIVIGEISIRHHFKGENAFFVSEAFNAPLIWFYVNDLFSRQRVKACVCGWVECLADQYNAAVWLVEQRDMENALPFSIDHIHKIYESANGEINGRSEKADR